MSDETKEDEAKTERFNMFLSPSEMKAIEEWAWANRIRSKSEAVRLLVQIGLLFDSSANGIAADFFDLTEAFSAKSLAALEKASSEDEEVRAQFTGDVFDLAIETEERMLYLRNRLNMVFQPYLALRSGDTFEGVKHHMLASQASAAALALQHKVDVFELKKKHGRLPKQEDDAQ
ncbi:hypothetical protein [Rhizobium rhizogenes]|uniref:hypothetical protein n=1 Tax=Rhizobium rhizogenes TaxID=359 RepID=UPI001571CF54|nr:hypothetical protein [Rhizobium rhizogenes]NTI41585.1 hypothetical protein [Rhizobium rhizogenes]